MPTFVDFAGMNTLILSTGSFDENNIIESQVNPEFSLANSEDELVGINLHRNGPYGYSSWKQLRASENPITRHHKANSTMTFVVQPGPMRNVLSNGELRVRDRYSALYTFTEPAIAQKAYPLVWNVGKHFKDENGNVDLQNPERFSIISSYANQGIGFANDQVDKLHKFDPDEEKTEYREIFKLYAEGGLNDQASPLTYWEFLQYRETIFPHMKNQFQNENVERPRFESFYRHNREDRTKLYKSGSGDFGIFIDNYNPPQDWIDDALDAYPDSPYQSVSQTDIDFSSSISQHRQSTWGLDAEEDFLTKQSIVYDLDGQQQTVMDDEFFPIPDPSIHYFTPLSFSAGGSGILQNNFSQLWINNDAGTISGLPKTRFSAPYYSRLVSLKNTSSISNPSGMIIPETSSISMVTFGSGHALWEAGRTRQIKDADGNWISAPKDPFYDTYEDYIEEARRRYKNFSIVPEFRMSTQIEDYLKNPGAIELDMFEVTGGVEGAENSSQSQFYEIYSNSDFMRQFELINEDHKDFTNGKVLSLRCKAVKKFLPYEGFYPAQRTVDLAKRFYNSFSSNFSFSGSIFLQDGETIVSTTPTIDEFPHLSQPILTPLFAPGVLFNTIKSGVAVDYPIMTSSLNVTGFNIGGNDEYLLYNSVMHKRIPFEAIVEPGTYLSADNFVSNEPHPSGNLSASATWDGQGDQLYSKMANNFTAEVPSFFLPNGQFTSVVSKKQKDITLEPGKVYGMRIKMRRSMNGARGKVYHYNSSSLSYYPPQDVNSGSSNVRENFTMYSRPSAFGPPSMGGSERTTGQILSYHSFDSDNEIIYGTNNRIIEKGSINGFNFPFTPPYYHGEAWCEVVLTASSDSMTIKEIQESASYTYKRFDGTYYAAISGSNVFSLIDDFAANGPQAIAQDRINQNAVQLSASLNIKGVGTISSKEGNSQGAQGNLIVDSAVNEDSRWIIQTKFETPMFNFNHISALSDTLSIPLYGSESVPRGMWHQYGRIPEENEGVFLEVGPIEQNYWTKARGETEELLDLSQALGFAGSSTKIGRLRDSKTIYEAVVAVPFIDNEGKKKFFRLDAEQISYYKQGGTVKDSLTQGDPQKQIGRSVLNQLEKMEKYIFPPSFDFLNFEDVDPIAMYIFEFSHTLNQQDLADIWQNLPPDIGTTMEESEIAITHPLLKKELLGEGGGQSGNTVVDMPNKLKWMVFKVKQRAASNYFKKTVLRNPEVNTDVESGNVTQDEFGSTSKIQYNWPYDFFSLVELVRLDAEVELGNADFSNYTDTIPRWNAVTADVEKIEYIVAGLEEEITPDPQVPEPEMEFTPEEIEAITGSAIKNREIKASQGAALIEESLQGMEIQDDLLRSDQKFNASELAVIRDRAAQGRAVVTEGVDFSSLEDFVNSVPSSTILELGIPRESFRNIANQAYSIKLEYDVAVAQFGPMSNQAQNLQNKLRLVTAPIANTSLLSSLLNNLNINFYTSVGPR